MKRWILVAAAVLAAVGVPLAVAGGSKVAIAEQPGGKAPLPPLEEGRSYFFAYEFSGDIRKLHAGTPGSVEGSTWASNGGAGSRSVRPARTSRARSRRCSGSTWTGWPSSRRGPGWASSRRTPRCSRPGFVTCFPFPVAH